MIPAWVPLRWFTSNFGLNFHGSVLWLHINFIQNYFKLWLVWKFSTNHKNCKCCQHSQCHSLLPTGSPEEKKWFKLGFCPNRLVMSFNNRTRYNIVLSDSRCSWVCFKWAAHPSNQVETCICEKLAQMESERIDAPCSFVAWVHIVHGYTNSMLKVAKNQESTKSHWNNISCHPIWWLIWVYFYSFFVFGFMLWCVESLVLWMLYNRKWC